MDELIHHCLRELSFDGDFGKCWCRRGEFESPSSRKESFHQSPSLQVATYPVYESSLPGFTCRTLHTLRSQWMNHTVPLSGPLLSGTRPYWWVRSLPEEPRRCTSHHNTAPSGSSSKGRKTSTIKSKNPCQRLMSSRTPEVVLSWICRGIMVINSGSPLIPRPLLQPSPVRMSECVTLTTSRGCCIEMLCDKSLPS